MNKKIDSMTILYNCLSDIFLKFISGGDLEKDTIFLSLFGIIIFDVIFNKENIVENADGINYQTLMSDNDLEKILLFIKDVDDVNAANVFATIRNKLAHGDYYLSDGCAYFNINNKNVPINIGTFIAFYMQLTDKLNARYKCNKYKNFRLLFDSKGKIDKLIVNEKELEELLKFYTLKEYTLFRCDGKELTSEEKIYLEKCINTVLNCNELTSREMDQKIKKFFNNNYVLDIKNHKMKSFNQKYFLFKEVMDNINESYNYDVNYLHNVIYTFGEEIYKILTSEFGNNPLVSAMEKIKSILGDMFKLNINNFNEYIKLKNKDDEYFQISLSYTEILSVINLAMIYFAYCYPLENIYKDNKVYIYTQNDLNFNDLNLNEIKPSINKLFDTGKNNLIKELDNKLSGLNKQMLKKMKNCSCLIEQRKSLIKKYNMLTGKERIHLKSTLEELNNRILNLDKEYETYLFKHTNLEEYKKELLGKIENDEYFRNFSIINGIRNSISHGGVKIINTGNMYDTILEFVDEYNGEIEFKLKISLFNLLSLTEPENTKITNQHLKKKRKSNDM